MEQRKDVKGHVVFGEDDDHVEKGFYYLAYEANDAEINALFDAAKQNQETEFNDRHGRTFILAYNRNDATYRLSGGAYS